MKKVLISTVAVFMSVCTIFSTSTLCAFAATNTKTEGNIIYYTENNNTTGIKSIKEKNTLYYDCTNNQKADVNTKFLMKHLSTPVQYQDVNGNTSTITPLSAWGNIAGAIFENGGQYTCTQNYHEFYSPTCNTGDLEHVNVAEKLSNESSTSNGSVQKDNSSSTGLSVASSFKDLRYKMCKHISDRIDRYTLSPEDILSQGDYCPDALPEFNDDTNREIIYNICTSIIRDGYTCKYEYNSYGVAFYDFDLKILDVPGIDYTCDASKTKTSSSVKDSILNTTKNNALYDVSAQTTTEISKSETISTSITNSNSYSYEEMFGGSVEIESGIVKGILETSITAAQAFESARTNETTTVSSVSQSKTVDYSVPAHTIMNVEQMISKDSMTAQYDVPVALTYKVAIFSMSGDVYADSVWTLGQSTAGYSQSNFSTFFGADSENEGLYAFDSLDKRVSNSNVGSWDNTHGHNHIFYKYHDGYSDPTNTTNYGIDWNSVMNLYDKNTGKKNGIKEVANKCPMLPTGATTTTTVENIVTNICEPQPMYNPSSFKVINNQESRYTIYVDGSFNLSTISIGAFDRFGAAYYDFLMKDGYWSVKEGSEDIIEYNKDSYTVKAKSAGTGTLVWRLKDGVEYTSAYDKTVVTNQNANPVEITFTVREYPIK